ncbi:pentatricopeptide repeat-containing protein, partial [Trifolium medium]|nr:pentatricopeptide repeat-containing protein [Trifolium medium]
MVASEVRPNEFTLSIILNACAGLRDGGLGTTIHGFLMKLGYGLDQFSTNALVDMYAKAGRIEDAV